VYNITKVVIKNKNKPLWLSWWFCIFITLSLKKPKTQFGYITIILKIFKRQIACHKLIVHCQFFCETHWLFKGFEITGIDSSNFFTYRGRHFTPWTKGGDQVPGWKALLCSNLGDKWGDPTVYITLHLRPMVHIWYLAKHWLLLASSIIDSSF